MPPRQFRQFDECIVHRGEKVSATLKKLNDEHPGYRTEGIVFIVPEYSQSYYKIFYSYIKGFAYDDTDTEEE